MNKQQMREPVLLIRHSLQLLFIVRAGPQIDNWGMNKEGTRNEE